MIYSLYLNKKNKKYEDLVHIKFKGIIFYINFFCWIFSKTEILPNSQGDWTSSNTVITRAHLLFNVFLVYIN